MCFSKFFLYLLHLSTCLIGLPVVYDFTFYLAHLEIPFKSLIQMVYCAETLCWSFLECIDYFSFELASSQFSSLFLVLLCQVPLGLIYTCLFGGCGAYDVNTFICNLSFIVFVSSFSLSTSHI